MTAKRLDPPERETALASLPAWRYDSGRDAIVRDFSFADFVGAFGFMAKVALLAERANHHPEWSNIYANVSILLTTHSANGLSELDIALAREIDRLI
ncbi:MAG: 4a-hydroxytetrahydrobiopterin dehydratase [Sphingomonadaceae bacterium]